MWSSCWLCVVWGRVKLTQNAGYRDAGPRFITFSVQSQQCCAGSTLFWSKIMKRNHASSQPELCTKTLPTFLRLLCHWICLCCFPYTLSTRGTNSSKTRGVGMHYGSRNEINSVFCHRAITILHQSKSKLLGLLISCLTASTRCPEVQLMLKWLLKLWLRRELTAFPLLQHQTRWHWWANVHSLEKNAILNQF